MYTNVSIKKGIQETVISEKNFLVTLNIIDIRECKKISKKIIFLTIKFVFEFMYSCRNT